MRKIFWFIIILVFAVAVYNYWPNLQNAFRQVSSLSKTVNPSDVVAELKKEILAPTPLRGSEDDPNAFLTRYGVISITNAERQQNGLFVLTENSKLDQAAQLKLQDMFAKQYFEHISPSGVGPGDLATEVHYEYITVGENLALGNFKDDQALVTAWMNSPGHRANILNLKFTEIGVAVGKGVFEGRTTWLAVQEFGKPASACPAVSTSLKSTVDTLNAQVQNLQQDLNVKKQQLDSLPLRTKADYDYYNQQAAAYNAEVADYNVKIQELKNDIAQYNTQVNSFNACVNES